MIGQSMNDQKHARHRAADAQVPDLWKQAQADGKSKNGAAKPIAQKLNLAESTVRKKLRGL